VGSAAYMFAALVTARRHGPVVMQSVRPVDELADIVTRLGEECPWTQAQEVGDVIGYAQAELLEAQQAVGAAEADELVDELGDVLFNTLLLIEVARRERPQVSLDMCAEAAVRKLRRRTPYLFGGPPATTIEEAEAAWQQAKAAERSRRGPPPAMRLSDGSTEPSLPRRCAVTAAAAAAVALTGAPRLATPLPPPRGAAEPLVPLLQCRVLLAELAALALGGGAVDWRGAQRVLRAPPFADVPRAVASYQASLAYGGASSLSAADRQLCFPRSDAASAKLAQRAHGPV
jgi:XTP/dITP diphosphohydrolase